MPDNKKNKQPADFLKKLGKGTAKAASKAEAKQARSEKAKKFFLKIKQAFIQLDKHVKEKAAERKAYRAGKRVKAKPQTEKRIEKASQLIQEAQQHKERPRARPRQCRPTKPEELVKNNDLNLNGEATENTPKEFKQYKQATGTPDGLIQAETRLKAYIDSPTDKEAVKGLNEAKSFLADFDDKSAATGGVITAAFIILLIFILSKL